MQLKDMTPEQLIEGIRYYEKLRNEFLGLPVKDDDDLSMWSKSALINRYCAALEYCEEKFGDW